MEMGLFNSGKHCNLNSDATADFKRGRRRAKRNMLLLATASGLGVMSALASKVQGQISVTNGNFTLPTNPTGADGVLPGFTELGGYAGIATPPASQFTGPLINPNMLEMNNGANIYQNLGTMQVGDTYNFNISYGWRNDIPQFEGKNFQFVLRSSINGPSAFVISQTPGWTSGGPTLPSGQSPMTAPLPTQTGYLFSDILSYTATPADNGQPLTLQIYIEGTPDTEQLDINQILLTTSVAAVDPTQLFYTGNVSGAFDSTAVDNFALRNGSSVQFTNDSTKTVTFSDTRIDNGNNVSNTSIVVQNGGVLPAVVNVTANNINYTFTDNNNTNGIGGPALLVKTGSSTLFLNGSNSYSGGTNISAGTVSINNNAAFGTGPITFTGEANLQLAASVALGNTVALGAGETTFNLSGNTLTLSSAVANTPTLGTILLPIMNVIGSGTLNLTGTLNVVNTSQDGNDPAILLSTTGVTANITATGTLGSISAGWYGSTNIVNLNPAGTLTMPNTDGSLDVGQQGGAGAVFQTGGTVNMAGNFNLARWDSSYGYYSITGGTLNIANGMNIGGFGSGTQFGGNSITYLTQSNGTINVTNNTVQVYQAAGTSSAYLTGGTYNNLTGSWILAQGSGSTASLTVANSAALNAGSIILSGNGSSVLNLNGGITTTGGITGGATATPTSIVNFNGGTLAVIGSGGTITNFMSGVSSALVYAGGAIIDSGSNSITIAQNLSSAGGSGGLNGTATLVAGGSGYISPPVVTVSGTGTGATAVATINSSGGVNSVTITSPGTGYTGTPTFNFLGGGGNASGAVFTAPAATANAVDGGLIKKGSGILTLSGSNTYKGATRVLAGTLQVAGPGATLVVPNGNFQATTVANPPGYIYNPSDPSWSYYTNGGGPGVPGAGIITNGGPFATNGTIPGSTQAAFLQNTGAIYQSINFPTTGTYTLSYYTEQRSGYTGQQVNIALDQSVVSNSTVTPPAAWTLETLQFYEQSGSHQLLIEGLNGNNTDQTAYVTDISLIAPYAGGSITNAIPSVSPVILSTGATLDVNSSVQTIGSLNGPSGSFVTLESGTLTVGGDGTNTTFAGNVSDNSLGGSLVKIGSGIQTLTGLSNSYTGSTNISGGTLILGVQGALPSGTPVIIGRGALLVADSQSTATAASSLNISGELIVHNGSIGLLTTAAAAGYQHGTWTGSTTAGAISSSAAAADTAHLTAVGVILNTMNGSTGAAALDNIFEGQTVINTDVLVKYTYYGDTDLNGKVDGTDYSRIDNGFLTAKTAHPLTGWFNGDFNYDGVINGSDYTLMDNAFNQQGTVISAQVATATALVSGSSAVPEPASLGLLTIGAAAQLGRRKRSQ